MAFRVKNAELQNAIDGMRAFDILGFTVTMPHKNTVIDYLDDLDPTARPIGAANTILNKQGKLIGFNTDGTGAVEALQRNGLGLQGKKALLIGAGGAAKSIACSLAPEVEALTILNRTISKAKELATTLEKSFSKRVTIDRLSTKTLQEKMRDIDLIINATNVGMAPDNSGSIIPNELLGPHLTVMDIVYTPVETKLIKDAKVSGAKAINGVEMLIYQGAKSFEIWTGEKAPIEVMKKAALDRLSNAGACD